MKPCGPCVRVVAIASVLVGTNGVITASDSGPALLMRYCGACHGDGADEGGVAFDPLLAALQNSSVTDGTARDHWVAVWKNLRAETMPPADEPQPSDAERQRLLDFVSRRVLGVDPDRPDPGQVVLRRLNRVEYANTVRDLTGIDANGGDELPVDDTGSGFDTIGAVLTMSPLHVEKYMAIATRLGDRVATEAVLIGKPGGQKEYPSHLRRLFVSGPPPDADADRPEHLRRTLRRLATRAFRRPIDDETLGRLVTIAEKAQVAHGGSFERGIAAAVTAVLASPRFLFRVEDDQPATGGTANTAVLIDEYALATRLSYFLWSTMPDDELFKLANEGNLRRELPGQITRMIQDRRCNAFARNFTGQWLQTRDVEGRAFDIMRVLAVTNWDNGEKVFNSKVRQAMRQETELLVAHVLREGLPATDLLTTRTTFLNEPLARFYGIPDVAGPEMRLVEIPAEAPRGGILTHGSFLMVTSNPTRTSPVKRGLFILENLLGTPAPPAPADVPAIEKAASTLGKHATMREVMELHRRDALCASCHARMDPLGLAFERYNALGQWRTDADASAIDTRGRLVTGEAFADVRELSSLIAGPRRRDFHRCLAEKLLTYALGRGLQYFDGPTVNILVEKAEEDGRLVTLVEGVVASVPFQQRRVGAGPAAASMSAPPTIAGGSP